MYNNAYRRFKLDKGDYVNTAVFVVLLSCRPSVVVCPILIFSFPAGCGVRNDVNDLRNLEWRLESVAMSQLDLEYESLSHGS